MAATSLLALLSITLAPLNLQDEESGGLPLRTLTPRRVVVGAPPSPEQGAAQELTHAPAPPTTSVVHEDDGVPLPIPAVNAPGLEGDTIVREASGDPFFLGFAAGPHHPPANELVDPLILERYRGRSDQRPGDFTYAMVMFSKRMTEQRLAELEAAGCRLLGFHPHYTMKVALPLAALGEVSTLPFVRWLGAPQAWQKLSHHTPELTGPAGPHELLAFHVNVWESDLNPSSRSTAIGTFEVTDGGSPYTPSNEDDQRARIWQSNGWMHAALLQRGIQVEGYTPSIDAFQVRITQNQLETLTALDFVLFVEPVLEPSLAGAVGPHDESIAMLAADKIRQLGHDGGAVTLGIIDSGVEVDHDDLSGVLGLGWTCVSGVSAWDDDIAEGGTGHGTHVAGSLLGRGIVAADHMGNASGAAALPTARLFNYRGFDPGTCLPGNVQIAVATFSNDFTDGAGNTSPRPMVVNNSWGFSAASVPIGSEANCRTLDYAVHEQDQLYVFAAGNDGAAGASTITIEGSAKNVLTVGSVMDFISLVHGEPGNLWHESSRGPTADGRWKPNVVAPGGSIRSLTSNDTSGYKNAVSTSMAAAHVTALAGTFLDHYENLPDFPALTSARVMASAITDDNRVIAVPSSSHLDTYGAGRVNAAKTHYYEAGHWEELIPIYPLSYLAGAWSTDFEVPAGTSRLVALIHYTEVPCSPGASAALVNNYDMWLDVAPFESGDNTGDYFAHQSTVDNTEIRIIDSPNLGSWRLKIYPTNASANGVAMGVFVYALMGGNQPDATLTLDIDDVFVQPDELLHLTATVDVENYIGSAVTLIRSGALDDLHSASTTLYDGVVTDLMDSAMGGEAIVLGDVLATDDRSGTWGLSYPFEGTKSIQVQAISDNMIDQTASVTVVVDGTEPGTVTNLTSISHTPGEWSNDPNITWTWTPATDGLSGIQGYGLYETGGCAAPAPTLDIGDVATFTGGPYGTSNTGRHLNIRTVDNCDVWDSDYECDGLYYIDLLAPGAPTFWDSDHEVGGKSCETQITVAWHPPEDDHSGVYAYSIEWSTDASTCPDEVFDNAGNWTWANLSFGTWYCHVRTVDAAGNWASCADVGHFGPFTIIPDCILFEDDFESGDFATKGWVIASPKRCTVIHRAKRNGLYGARLKKGGKGTPACLTGTEETWIELPPIDASGWSDVRIEFNGRVHFTLGQAMNLAVCETLGVQWWDGSDWQTISLMRDMTWRHRTVYMPAEALGNPALRIRFFTNLKGKKERAELDDVQVIATR